MPPPEFLSFATFVVMGALTVLGSASVKTKRHGKPSRDDDEGVPTPLPEVRIVAFDSDGVRLTTRFIPYSEIATVLHARFVDVNAIGSRPNVQNLIVLHLHSGQEVRVLTVKVRVESKHLASPDSMGVSAAPDKETLHRLERLRSCVLASGPGGRHLMKRGARVCALWRTRSDRRSCGWRTLKVAEESGEAEVIEALSQIEDGDHGKHT